MYLSRMICQSTCNMNNYTILCQHKRNGQDNNKIQFKEKRAKFKTPARQYSTAEIIPLATHVLQTLKYGSYILLAYKSKINMVALEMLCTVVLEKYNGLGTKRIVESFATIGKIQATVTTICRRHCIAILHKAYRLWIGMSV